MILFAIVDIFGIYFKDTSAELILRYMNLKRLERERLARIKRKQDNNLKITKEDEI